MEEELSDLDEDLDEDTKRERHEVNNKNNKFLRENKKHAPKFMKLENEEELNDYFKEHED
jgi:hypothetical protein